MQADAYSGFNGLYAPGRGRRRSSSRLLGACATLLFDLARLNKGADPLRPVARIDALFAIEPRSTDCHRERRRVRQERSKSLVEWAGHWLREHYGKVSPNGKTGKAIAYSLNAWDALVRSSSMASVHEQNNAASGRCARLLPPA